MATVTFVGNATTLLRLGDFTLLTDPAFGLAGSRVYLGYGAWTKRLKGPVLGPLAGVTPDAVLLSHLHGDHFDAEARRQLSSDLPILTTPQVERRLRRRNFTAVLTEIPQRFGEIDAMLIHLGGTKLLGMLLTMDDRQGVDLTALIRPGSRTPGEPRPGAAVSETGREPVRVGDLLRRGPFETRPKRERCTVQSIVLVASSAGD